MEDLEPAGSDEVVHRLRAQSLALVERARRRRRAIRVSLLGVTIVASLIGYDRLDAYRAQEERFAKARAEFDAREAARSAASLAESRRVDELIERAEREADRAQRERRPSQREPELERIERAKKRARTVYYGDDQPLD